MNEKNYYVLSWNSEYLSNAILAGPITFEEAGEFLRKTAIERIGELGLDDDHDTFAEHLYDMAEDEILADGIDDVSVSPWEVCLQYAGQEERISIVQYNQEPAAPEIKEEASGGGNSVVRPKALKLIPDTASEGAEMAAVEAVQSAMEKGTMIYLTSAKCPRCGRPLYTSDIPGYPLLCPACDENFYHIEVKDYDSDLFEIHIPMGAEYYRKNKGKFLKHIALAEENGTPSACFMGYDDITGYMDLGYSKDNLPSADTLSDILRQIESV